MNPIIQTGITCTITILSMLYSLNLDFLLENPDHNFSLSSLLGFDKLKQWIGILTIISGLMYIEKEYIVKRLEHLFLSRLLNDNLITRYYYFLLAQLWFILALEAALAYTFNFDQTFYLILLNLSTSAILSLSCCFKALFTNI